MFTARKKNGSLEPSATRLLIVDADAAFTSPLAGTLRRRGYAVEVAETAAQAMTQARPSPDLVVLDLDLRDMDGLEAIASLSHQGAMPVIVLSSRNREMEKVAALDAGAIDYVVKPVGIEELAARLRAARRRNTIGPSDVVTTAAFTIDLVDKTVTRAERRVHLTPIEWRILEVLARTPGHLVTQQQLLSQVWGPGHEDRTNYLRVHLNSMRKKLEPVPGTPAHLTTEAGFGYRLQI